MAEAAGATAPGVDAKVRSEVVKPGIGEKKQYPVPSAEQRAAQTVANKLTVITNTEGPTAAMAALAEGTTDTLAFTSGEQTPNVEAVKLARSVRDDDDYQRCLRERTGGPDSGGYMRTEEVNALRDFEAKYPEKALLYREQYARETDAYRDASGVIDAGNDLYFQELGELARKECNQKLLEIKTANADKSPMEQLTLMADAYLEARYAAEKDVYAEYKTKFPQKAATYGVVADLKAEEALRMLKEFTPAQKAFETALNTYTIVNDSELGKDFQELRGQLPSEGDLRLMAEKADVPWGVTKGSSPTESVQPLAESSNELSGQQEQQNSQRETVKPVIKFLLYLLKKILEYLPASKN